MPQLKNIMRAKNVEIYLQQSNCSCKYCIQICTASLKIFTVLLSNSAICCLTAVLRQSKGSIFSVKWFDCLCSLFAQNHNKKTQIKQLINQQLMSFCLLIGEDRPRENIVGTADGQAMVGGAGVESGAERQKLNCCLRVTAVQVRKAIWGVAMVMCVCSSWAGSTQLAKLTFKQYDAPFTLTWFATTWNCLFFPLYYIGHLCKSPERQTPKQRFR